MRCSTIVPLHDAPWYLRRFLAGDEEEKRASEAVEVTAEEALSLPDLWGDIPLIT